MSKTKAKTTGKAITRKGQSTSDGMQETEGFYRFLFLPLSLILLLLPKLKIVF